MLWYSRCATLASLSFLLHLVLFPSIVFASSLKSATYDGLCTCLITRCQRNPAYCFEPVIHGKDTPAFCATGPGGNQLIYHNYTDYAKNAQPYEQCSSKSLSPLFKEDCDCMAFEQSQDVGFEDMTQIYGPSHLTLVQKQMNEFHLRSNLSPAQTRIFIYGGLLFALTAATISLLRLRRSYKLQIERGMQDIIYTKNRHSRSPSPLSFSSFTASDLPAPASFVPGRGSPVSWLQYVMPKVQYHH